MNPFNATYRLFVPKCNPVFTRNMMFLNVLFQIMK